MATIRRRGDLQWQALIRKRGYPMQSKTFATKAEAEAWAAVVESEMVRGLFVSRAEAEQTTLGAILQRYEQEVAPMHKDVVTESYRLRQVIEHSRREWQIALPANPVKLVKCPATTTSAIVAWARWKKLR